MTLNIIFFNNVQNLYPQSRILSPIVDLHHVLDVYTWASDGHLKFSQYVYNWTPGLSSQNLFLQLSPFGSKGKNLGVVVTSSFYHIPLFSSLAFKNIPRNPTVSHHLDIYIPIWTILISHRCYYRRLLTGFLAVSTLVPLPVLPFQHDN